MKRHTLLLLEHHTLLLERHTLLLEHHTLLLEHHTLLFLLERDVMLLLLLCSFSLFETTPLSWGSEVVGHRPHPVTHTTLWGYMLLLHTVPDRQTAPFTASSIAPLHRTINCTIRGAEATWLCMS